MVVKKETAIHALKLAKKHNRKNEISIRNSIFHNFISFFFFSFQVITVFNFAPAVEDCHKEFSELVDILIVNEIEVSYLILEFNWKCIDLILKIRQRLLRHRK